MDNNKVQPSNIGWTLWLSKSSTHVKYEFIKKYVLNFWIIKKFNLKVELLSYPKVQLWLMDTPHEIICFDIWFMTKLYTLEHVYCLVSKLCRESHLLVSNFMSRITLFWCHISTHWKVAGAPKEILWGHRTESWCCLISQC